MIDSQSHLEEILRLYSEELVVAAAKIGEIRAAAPELVEQLNTELQSIKRRFLDELEVGVNNISDASISLVESVEATRVEMLAQHAALVRAAAESVGRDLKAANDGLQTTSKALVLKSAQEALSTSLVPMANSLTQMLEVAGKDLLKKANEASQLMVKASQQAQREIATTTWRRWLMIGGLLFGMTFSGTGLWWYIDRMFPWQLTPEQAQSLAIGQTVEHNWSKLDGETQKALNLILKGN